jgi:hypothetical protein
LAPGGIQSHAPYVSKNRGQEKSDFEAKFSLIGTKQKYFSGQFVLNGTNVSPISNDPEPDQSPDDDKPPFLSKPAAASSSDRANFEPDWPSVRR